MCLLTTGCVIFPISPFCSGRGVVAAPAMMSASSRCTAIATSLPATSLPRPPEWSGWAWAMTILPTCSGGSPGVSGSCSIGPELPQSPASTNSTFPFSTRAVTLAPIARILNTPPVIAIGLPNIISLVCTGWTGWGASSRPPTGGLRRHVPHQGVPGAAGDAGQRRNHSHLRPGDKRTPHDQRVDRDQDLRQGDWDQARQRRLSTLSPRRTIAP